MFNAPTTRSSASTTSSAWILCASIRRAASIASLSAAIVFGLTRHQRGDRRGAQVDVVVVDRAAQVAVGEDAEQAAVGIDDRGHAQALARHLDQRVGQAGVGADARNRARRCA